MPKQMSSSITVTLYVVDVKSPLSRIAVRKRFKAARTLCAPPLPLQYLVQLHIISLLTMLGSVHGTEISKELEKNECDDDAVKYGMFCKF